MQNLHILNNKEIKEIKQMLYEQFGFDSELDFAFLRNKEGRLFIISKDFARLDTKGLSIDSLGLYFGKIEKDGVRLSVEGSQIVGPFCKKNVLELSDDDVVLWIGGDNMVVEKGLSGIYIIKNNNDFIGCGKAGNGVLYNFLPKARRIKLE